MADLGATRGCAPRHYGGTITIPEAPHSAAPCDGLTFEAPFGATTAQQKALFQLRSDTIKRLKCSMVNRL